MSHFFTPVYGLEFVVSVKIKNKQIKNVTMLGTDLITDSTSVLGPVAKSIKKKK